jgi:tetratricopeptide (TPR) repeat protein
MLYHPDFGAMLRCGFLVLVSGLLSLSVRGSEPLDYYPALMDTLVSGHFSAADSICDAMAIQHGGHPGVYYARATVRYAHMMDYEDTLGRGLFMAYTDTCIALCDEWRRTHPQIRAELAYLRGSSLASRGLLLNSEGKLLPGLRQLISAKGAFDEAIEADPTFYDAYLGRGAYRYGVARFSSLLRWLPMIPTKESGWKDMWLAVDRSRFSKYFALSGMLWFALDEKQYELVDSVCSLALERFPESRTFLWSRLVLYENTHRWTDEEAVATILLNQYLALPDNNGFQTTDLYRMMMEAADSLAQPDKALAYARAGLETFRTDEMTRRRKDDIQHMQARLLQEQ